MYLTLSCRIALINQSSLKKVQEQAKLSRRTLHNVLETLKKKGHPVGSHKTAPFGLYMAKTKEELEIGMRANVKQAETTLEIARVQRGIDLDEYWKEAFIAH